MLIKRIKRISNAGVFRSYSATEDANLSKLNLFYGFNGSGKTTISRLFSSIADGKCCDLLPEETKFEFELENGIVISQDRHLDYLKGKVAVFNSDYVERNFQWKDGSANPVFYIGNEQAERGRELHLLEQRLENAQVHLTAVRAELERTSISTARLKRDLARNIGEQVGLRNYNAGQLDRDFAAGEWRDDKLLNERQRDVLRATIFQTTPLPSIGPIIIPNVTVGELTSLIFRVKECLIATIGTLSLADLSEHQTMLGWVKHGYMYHTEHSLRSCLFCSGQINDDRLAALALSLDQKFDRIVAQTGELVRTSGNLKDNLENAATKLPSQNDIVQEQRAIYLEAVVAYAAATERICKLLLPVIEALTAKAINPNTIIDPNRLPARDELDAAELAINEAVALLNRTIADHDKEVEEFEARRAVARDTLRGHFLAECRENYLQAVQQFNHSNDASVTANDAANDLSQQINMLRRALRKHAPAAEVINSLIRNYLRHSDIEIVAHGEAFQIRRTNGRAAKSLSEGEKTAVTFCYFISSLTSEGRRLRDTIVVVDDPISSLDTKALNYVFSLIKSHVADCYQLLIMTHNINFLNSCRSWLKTKARNGDASMLYLDLKADIGGNRYTTIVKLPKLIRDYDSEYHYLFSLVLHFARSDSREDERLFLLPNAMRKVAEIFLTFKRPGPDGLASKIEAVARGGYGVDPARIRALDRLIQLESHADSLDDLVSFSSMTIEETHECAVALMEFIEILDPEHFHLQSRQCTSAA
jgi:wobble nucleotide-excising tRNase